MSVSEGVDVLMREMLLKGIVVSFVDVFGRAVESLIDCLGRQLNMGARLDF